MILIPAIDLKDGHCVRLKQGDMDQATTFGEDPAALAVGAGFETRTLDRSAEEGQERTQDEDHHEQACFGQSQVLGGGE